MSSIFKITLHDPTGHEFPPAEVLNISSVGDLVFFSIDEYEEDGRKSAYKTKQDICLSLPALREAVEFLSHDRDRESSRPRDEHGEASADIAGHRWKVAPL